MNDRIDFERLVNERFAREHDVRPPDRAVDQILIQAGRARPLPRWLALIKEPSMRYSSTLGVGSPTARVLAILAATLLLVTLVTAAGAGAARLLAADGQIIVDASGGGTHTAIADALADSRDGDVILVRPGSYVEAVLIDKDITLVGDGPREDIVVSAPVDGPTVVFAETGGIQQFETPYSLLIADTLAEVRGMTFAGAETSVVVDGGSPTLSDLVFDGNDFGLLIQSGSTATVTDSLMSGGGGIEVAGSSEPLIARNVLRDGASIVGSMGDGGVVRANVLTDPSNGIGLGGIAMGAPTSALIEGNTITGASGYAISTFSAEAGAPVIRDNTISGSRNGIQVGAGSGDGVSTGAGPDVTTAQPLVSGNDISAELVAISVTWTDAKVIDNNIQDSFNGIVLFGGGSADVLDNKVEVEGNGIDIGANTSPNVAGNSACGGSASIKIHDTATPSMGENTTCDAD